MAFTNAEKEVNKYLSENDFVSKEMIDSFHQKLTQVGDASYLKYALEDFVVETCPKCSASGNFKFHFWGKLNHNPGCNCSWYVSPGKYVSTQLAKTFRTGRDIGGDMALDSEKKGESGGFVSLIFGFLFGAAFRLSFAAVMIPIQTIVSVIQKKPN